MTAYLIKINQRYCRGCTYYLTPLRNKDQKRIYEKWLFYSIANYYLKYSGHRISCSSDCDSHFMNKNSTIFIENYFHNYDLV